jgi:hypothetical protein
MITPWFKRLAKTSKNAFARRFLKKKPMTNPPNPQNPPNPPNPATPPNRPAPPNPPSLEVPADVKAVYANLVRIAHSPSELVLDFAHLLPGTIPARVNTRVVMSPLGAKLLHRALTENLARYEAAFGEIKVPGEASLADYLFRPPPPAKPGE